MGKKKIMKDDGITEDFDAEALEPDEAGTDGAASPDATGDMGDLLPPTDKPAEGAEGDASGKSDTAPAPDAAAASPDVSTPGADTSVASPEAPEAGKDAPASAATGVSDSATSTSGGVTDSAAAPSDETASVTGAAATSDEAASDEAPKLAEPHPEAQPAVDVAPDVMDTFKEVGNLLTPALKELSAKFEEKIEGLEDEAKNRFSFMRQKATECLAALETIFKRD